MRARDPFKTVRCAIPTVLTMIIDEIRFDIYTSYRYVLNAHVRTPKTLINHNYKKKKKQTYNNIIMTEFERQISIISLLLLFFFSTR